MSPDIRDELFCLFYNYVRTEFKELIAARARRREDLESDSSSSDSSSSDSDSDSEEMKDELNQLLDMINQVTCKDAGLSHPVYASLRAFNYFLKMYTGYVELRHIFFF